MTETPETETDTAAPAAGLLAKRLPEEWEEEYGLRVIDADGWREPGAPAWTDPITLPDFYARYCRSTVAGLTDELYERLHQDVKAARQAEAAVANAAAERTVGSGPDELVDVVHDDLPSAPQEESHAERLKRAAAALRMRGWAGDHHAADVLERCQPIANRLHEQHARPFMPLLDSALRLARTVLDEEPDQKPLITHSGKKLIRMAVTGEMIGQILHLPSEIRVHGVDYYAQLDRLDFLVHHPEAPAEAIRMSPVFERTSGWPDPIHLCDIRYAYPPGITPPAEPPRPADAETASEPKQDNR